MNKDEIRVSFQNVHQNFGVVLRYLKKHFRYFEKLFYGLQKEIKLKSPYNVDHRINQTQNQLDKVLKIVKRLKKEPNLNLIPRYQWNELIVGESSTTWFNHHISIKPDGIGVLSNETSFKITIDNKLFVYAWNLKDAKTKVYNWCDSQIKNNITIFMEEY